MTDLQKFIDLYKQFGIDCKVNHCNCNNKDVIVIQLSGNKYNSDFEITKSEKFDGYGGFF